MVVGAERNGNAARSLCAIATRTGVDPAIGDVANTLVNHPRAHGYIVFSGDNGTWANTRCGALVTEAHRGGGGKTEVRTGTTAGVSPADQRIQCTFTLFFTAQQIIKSVIAILHGGLGQACRTEVIGHHVQALESGAGVELCVGTGSIVREGNRHGALGLGLRFWVRERHGAGFRSKAVDRMGANGYCGAIRIHARNGNGFTDDGLGSHRSSADGKCESRRLVAFRGAGSGSFCGCNFRFGNHLHLVVAFRIDRDGLASQRCITADHHGGFAGHLAIDGANTDRCQ